MSRRIRKPGSRPWMVLLVALLLPLGYLLSYAPVVKAMGGTRPFRTVNMLGEPVASSAPLCGMSLPLYRLADWLIDHTPLRQPLFAWAGLWGVLDVFTEATLWR